MKIICRRVINAAGLYCIKVNMFPTFDEKIQLGFGMRNYFFMRGSLFKN